MIDNQHDFLGMGLIIKEQATELERLRIENQRLRDDIAWKDNIIKAADIAMDRMRLRHLRTQSNWPSSENPTKCPTREEGMSDIVARLLNKNWLWTVPGALREEAAAEIERLRAHNAELLAALKGLLDFLEALLAHGSAIA
jgi:hypothetical protein